MKIFLTKFYAFLRKDIKIGLSYKFNILIQILAIFFVVSIIFFSLNSTNNQISNSSSIEQNYEFFQVLIGIALIDFMFSSMSVFAREVRLAQTYGTFETLMITNTSILTILLSSYALTFSRSILRILIYILLGKFIFGLAISFGNIPAFLFLVIYSAIPFIGIGLIAASFIILFKVGNIITLFTGLTSIFFSGIFFSIESLPSVFADISNNLPLTIGLDLAKEALVGGISVKQVYPGILVIFYQIALLIPTSILLVYYSLKIAKKNGSLNFY
tara:strand:- start:1302 stop:2117 length:816 start_codon:yes stop_codon:yes gene_type:complete